MTPEHCTLRSLRARSVCRLPFYYKVWTLLMDSDEANAAKCRQLAERHADPADRNRWMAMARFWSQRGKVVSEPQDATAKPERVKV